MLPRLGIRPGIRLGAGLAAVTLALGLLAACSGDPSTPEPPTTTGTAATATAPSGRIALLVPGPPLMRHEAFDKRAFGRAVADLCPDCRVDSYDAKGEAPTQSDQLATAVGSGARLLVIDAVEPLALVNQVAAARESGIKVVGYDTLLDDIDAYVAYDRSQIGTLQGDALADANRDDGNLLMVNGSPADVAAAQVKAAAHQVIDRSGAAVVGEYDALPDEPADTRSWLATVLAFNPPSTLGGVYAADDALAGTALHALVAAGADPADLPPVTGAGARLVAIKRIVSGRQLMTVYRPVAPAVETTARVAVAELVGGDPGAPTTSLDGVPAYLLPPVAVTRKNVADTVVADGYWTPEEICTERLRDDCRTVGIR